MKWEEARARYPQQWLLVEAINAHSESGKRMLDELSVIGSFEDSTKALQRYSQLHNEAPGRELYVFHTSRSQLDVVERQWLGIRAAG